MKWGREQGASKNTKMRRERFGSEIFSGEIVSRRLFPAEVSDEALAQSDRTDLRRITPQASADPQENGSLAQFVFWC
jgi:hypothetical protein